MMLASQPSDVGLRERKKAEARAALVEAALELFEQRGYSDVTIDQIAEQAGVSRRTYFRYFPTKEAVLLDRRLSQLASFRSALAAAPLSVPALDVLKAALTGLAAEYRQHRARILVERALFASAGELSGRDGEIDRAFEQVIVDAVLARARKGPLVERSARFFAGAAMGVLRVLLEEWARGDGDLDLVKVGKPALDMVAPLAPAERGSDR